VGSLPEAGIFCAAWGELSGRDKEAIAWQEIGMFDVPSEADRLKIHVGSAPPARCEIFNFPPSSVCFLISLQTPGDMAH